MIVLGYRDVTGFDDLELTARNDGVLVDTGHGIILLQGMELADVDAGDFEFPYSPETPTDGM